ncbi:MAG: type VI secretion system tip protein VgrG [Acidobacteria bacterium]|nr:type VI secretion system tip protein VgrG [Acidobacteriota bacterium]
MPHFWLLTQNSQSRIFQNMSVPEILAKVLEGLEVTYEIQGTFEPRNYCVQYRESDFNFASRLMEEEGIYYYFVHTADSHRMIVANTPGSHRDCPTKSEIPFRLDISTNPDEWQGAVHSWQVTNKLRAGKFTLRDFNFQLPTNNLEAVQMSRFNIGGNQDLEIYDYPGAYASRFDGIDAGGGEQSGVLQRVFDDRTRTVGIRQQELDVAYKSSPGTSDCCSMTAGFRFQLTSHPESANNRNHVLVSLRIEATQSPSYISDENVQDAYSVAFISIPQGEGQAPFRPIRRTEKPTVSGSQTAIVVGPAGEEIFTDKFGRVKVQFHWDREGRNNATSSCWLRVSTSIAGNKWGTMFIPRVGQEVIVDFLEGNPDSPIITGSVYNPETMPHYDLPKFKTLTYIKTRTSPDDGKGFNELRFEDKAGKEQVFIRSQKRYDLRARGSMYETCGGNRQEVIGVRSDNQPGGNLAVTVGGNYDLHIKDSHYVGIDGKLNESVKGDVVEDYQANLSTIVKAKTELNAREITLEALTKISLKVGGNCIMIDPSGITIAGTVTKINSGGFAAGTGNPAFDDALDAETADTGEPGYLDRPRSGGGGGRRRRNLRSQHYIAPPRPGEDPRITAMRGTLANSEQGRHALEVYDRYGVSSSFRPGEGSTFDPGDNNMNINPAQTPDRQALGFVHEMNHAEEHHEGTSGDIENQTRDEYVDAMVDEESEGVVRSIEARDELIESGHESAAETSYPLQDEYHTAYDQGVADARAANPNISDADAAAAGRAAGRQRVEDGFRNGEVETSNSGEGYPDYYGNAWDGAHPAGGGTP